MKKVYYTIFAIVVVVGLFYILNSYIYKQKQIIDVDKTVSEHVKITPIAHATAVLDLSGKIIYTDPTGGEKAYEGQPKPDFILVTDIHGDHLSTSTLLSVMGVDTVLIVPKAVQDLLPEELSSRSKVLNNDEGIIIDELEIMAFPMYNLPESNESRHVRGRGNGYTISHNNFNIYIAGDTSDIPEMRELEDIDVAFIPMNLPFTMSVEAAADAVSEFKPKKVYPFHYRGQDGLADVDKFKQLVNSKNKDIEVVLLNWYPEKKEL